MKVFHGNILTLDSKNTVVNYLVEKNGKIAFVGDTLFAGSCGRTDLLGGDYETLMISLAHLKRIIPPDTTLLCGHGPATTMAQELATNPWLQ